MAEEEKTQSEPDAATKKPAPKKCPVLHRWLMAPDTGTKACRLIPQPPGRPPKGKEWDGVKGEWAEEEEGTGSAAGEQAAKRRKGPHRAFSPGWKIVLPTLLCVSVLAAGASCLAKDDCPGCAACAKTTAAA